MGILSDFEDRIGAGIEGLFAGAFRSPVQPAELAKTLGRAMDDGRTVGVGKVYVPLAYTIALSAEDDAQFGAFKPTLAGELATYLVDHAHEHSYALASRPTVAFTVHDDLRLGRFRVSATLAPGDIALDSSAASVSRFAPAPGPSAGIASVTVGEFDHDVALRGEQLIVGRLSDCQICLADTNVSRRHAAFINVDGGWAIEDLESTNGTRLNGRPVARARLHDGDVIEIGLTHLVFHEARD